MDKQRIVEEISKGASTVIQLMQLDTHEIKIVAQRKGYTPPSIGNYVRVRVELHLPTEGDTTNIPYELQYGLKKQLLGEWMFQDWGLLRSNTRMNSITNTAETWREAVIKGLDEIEEELQGLVDLMKERQEALKRAEG